VSGDASPSPCRRRGALVTEPQGAGATGSAASRQPLRVLSAPGSMRSMPSLASARIKGLRTGTSDGGYPPSLRAALCIEPTDDAHELLRLICLPPAGNPAASISSASRSRASSLRLVCSPAAAKSSASSSDRASSRGTWSSSSFETSSGMLSNRSCRAPAKGIDSALNRSSPVRASSSTPVLGTLSFWPSGAALCGGSGAALCISAGRLRCSAGLDASCGCVCWCGCGSAWRRPSSGPDEVRSCSSAGTLSRGPPPASSRPRATGADEQADALRNGGG